MKKKISLIITIILVLSLTTLVYGVSAQININGDETAKEGETKELTINISSDEEIGIVSGKIEANSNITEMTVTGINKWSLTYNENTGVFNIVKAAGAKTEGIIKIRYKAGSEGTGTITLSDIKMTTINYEQEEKEDIIKNITITKEQKETGGEGTNQDTNKEKQNNEANQGTNKENNQTKQYTTNNGAQNNGATSGNNLPKTGFGKYLIAMIICTSILSIIYRFNLIAMKHC